jgi:hypothetical protein
MANATLIRLDEYARLEINGEVKICATTHGVRINPSHVSKIQAAGTGYDENGNNPTDVYRVTFVNGLSTFTDTNGLNDIDDVRRNVDIP